MLQEPNFIHKKNRRSALIALALFNINFKFKHKSDMKTKKHLPAQPLAKLSKPVSNTLFPGSDSTYQLVFIP